MVKKHSDDFLKRVRDLRALNMTVLQIAQELSVTKGTISGCIDRMQAGKGIGATSAPDRSQAMRGPVASVVELRRHDRIVSEGELKRNVRSPAKKNVEKPALPTTLASPAPPTVRTGNEPCSYPIGTPRTPGFRYCDAPTVFGKPYCPEHCTVAYASRETVG